MAGRGAAELIRDRVLVAQLEGQGTEVLCGRVVANGELGARVVDSSGGVIVAGITLRPGDWVAIEGSLGRNGIFVAGHHVVVTPHRKATPFPSPDDEFARLGPRLGRLALRDRTMRAVRRFFHDKGFLEVDTPLIVPSPGLELHLDAVPAGKDRWLITSPEYQMKRVLAAGTDRIFSICKCFRAGERGPQHNPEFTMLEWYRAWAGYEDIMNDVEQLGAAVAHEVRGSVRFALPDGGDLDLEPPWERITVREAMDRYAGVELSGDETAQELAARVKAAGLPPPAPDAPWDDVFFGAFLTAVEPRLGWGRPTILTEWPAPLAALAQAKPGDPRVVERFEVYAGGLELGNAFGELIDPTEQRRRFSEDLKQRDLRGKPLYPVDRRFLAALDEGLPPSAGIALGMDRLVMLMTGVRDIQGVVAFTEEEL